MSELQIVETKVERKPIKLRDVPPGRFFRFGTDGIHFQKLTRGYSCVNSGEFYELTLEDEYQTVELAVSVTLGVVYE